MSPTHLDGDVAFRAFRQFGPDSANFVSSRSRLTPYHVQKAFGSDTLPDRIARVLAPTEAVPIKELVETFELFEKLRKRLRAATVVDLCCGHGLLGLLFALLEKSVERVILADAAIPSSHRAILDALSAVAPWVAQKVTVLRAGVGEWPDRIEVTGVSSVVSSHACGELTDRCIEFAADRGAAVGVMPCCYPKRACTGPPAVARSVGHELAFDIHRTYTLESRGYAVSWSRIPRAVTPMNRILIAVPRKQ